VSVWRQVRAIALLPFMAAAAIPALIVWRTEEAGLRWWLALPGAALIVAGILLAALTVALVAKVGRGTLAPWDPTERLVVRGPYRRVRNPMITGVLCMLLGEAALFGSVPLLIWAGGFLAVNAVYLPLVEEPGLRTRFGEDYETYRANVPRWLPRLRPWDPST
jgi:protein-S-isoprenylcysteine O-methyltransferase Ste14